MDKQDLDEISKHPKFAFSKRKPVSKLRSVKDLFNDVGPEATFKDKRGRPWVKNPRLYAKTLLAKLKRKKDLHITSSESSDDRISSSEYSESSSSSDSEVHFDASEVISDLQGADWYELTKDAAPTNITSNRLALLHFDWDNAKPETIYMILESFLPARGHIEKVTIYPSEFGIKRLAEEAVHGPPELRPTDSDLEENANDLSTNDNNVSTDIDDKAGWCKTSQKLRRRIREYQLARLKYFYAIIEFDSVQTAEAIYEACDGFEYESSGSRLDLRFVDPEQTFDVAPEHAYLVSECREINKAKYEPKRFETSALHSTRIGITWDKTPIERTNWLRDQFRSEIDPQTTLNENKDELSKYLALSSSGASTAASSDVESEPPAPTVPRIHRHRPKKMPPAEVRLALLGLVDSDVRDNNQELDEDVEEIFDLPPLNQDDNNNSDQEEYDLRPVEKKKSKIDITNSSKRVHRKILPEAKEFERDSSADSDNILNDNEEVHDNKIQKKREKKLKNRQKMLEKKRKLQSRIERETQLWSTEQEDDRFDEFFKNPAFEISQTHTNYKEAKDFLHFIQKRRMNSNKKEKL